MPKMKKTNINILSKYVSSNFNKVLENIDNFSAFNSCAFFKLPNSHSIEYDSNAFIRVK